MHALCLLRRTFDPRELSSLRIADHQVVADRVQLVKNEGDVRAIQLVKGSGAAFEAASIGELDATTRVHLFVYGAEEVWELGAAPAHGLEEAQMARMIAAGTHTSAPPTNGRMDNTIISSPQSTAPETPRIAKITPPSVPCTRPMRSVPLSVARVTETKRCNI